MVSDTTQGTSKMRAKERACYLYQFGAFHLSSVCGGGGDRWGRQSGGIWRAAIRRDLEGGDPEGSGGW